MILIKRDNINNIAYSYLSKIKSMRFRDGKFGHLFSNNIDELVLCSPEDFQSIICKYAPLVSPYEDFNKYMIGQYERVFYEEHIGEWLAKELNVNVCPYCNRQYTFTVKSNQGKTFKPQFDHFYSKSKYPYLALSLFNLIPSCPECNRIKSDQQLAINPYIEDFGDCKFNVSKIENVIFDAKDNAGWSVGFINNTPSHNKHIDILALDKLYNGHKDYISEIIYKAKCYPAEYIDDLKKILTSFNGVSLTDEQIKRLIFGNYTKSVDFEKRTLSKLTSDILNQLNFKF